LMLAGGLAAIAVGAAGFVIRPIRDIETLLPDYEPGDSPFSESTH